MGGSVKAMESTAYLNTSPPPWMGNASHFCCSNDAVQGSYEELIHPSPTGYSPSDEAAWEEQVGSLQQHCKVTVATGPLCLQLPYTTYPIAYRMLRGWLIALLCSSPLETLSDLQAGVINSLLIISPLKYVLKGQAVSCPTSLCPIPKHAKEGCIHCTQGKAAWTSWSTFALKSLQGKIERRTHLL